MRIFIRTIGLTSDVKQISLDEAVDILTRHRKTFRETNPKSTKEDLLSDICSGTVFNFHDKDLDKEEMLIVLDVDQALSSIVQ